MREVFVLGNYVAGEEVEVLAASTEEGINEQDDVADRGHVVCVEDKSVCVTTQHGGLQVR